MLVPARGGDTPMKAFSARADAPVDRTVWVRLRGEADMAVSDLLLRMLLDAAAVDGVREVVVDLAAVTFLDASVVGVLLAARTAAERRGRLLRVDGADG